MGYCETGALPTNYRRNLLSSEISNHNPNNYGTFHRAQFPKNTTHAHRPLFHRSSVTLKSLRLDELPPVSTNPTPPLQPWHTSPRKSSLPGKNIATMFRLSSHPSLSHLSLFGLKSPRLRLPIPLPSTLAIWSAALDAAQFFSHSEEVHVRTQSSSAISALRNPTHPFAKLILQTDNLL